MLDCKDHGSGLGLQLLSACFSSIGRGATVEHVRHEAKAERLSYMIVRH
jgi:hypothetical protein